MSESAGDPTRHEWWKLIRDVLMAQAPSLPVDSAAAAVLRALEDAGLDFPARGRRPAPATLEEHLEEAARLLEMSLAPDLDGSAPGGYHVADDHCLAQVAAAEVHARIAHAGSALLMVAGRETTVEGPGLPALEKLADAMAALAETVDVRRMAIRTRST